MKTVSIGLSLLVALALAGCNRPSSDASKQSAPKPSASPSAQSSARVTDVNLGRSLTADRTIGDRTDSFAPADTIYVTVKTEGSGASAALLARWTYEDGQVVE